MAAFDGSDLKAWRSSLGVTAADLAERISCDTTTVYRYESGKINPDPDVMYQICQELGDTRKWESWMRTEYPRSYGRMHPEPVQHDLPGSVLSLYESAQRLMEAQGSVFRDAADGCLDSEEIQQKVMDITDDLISAGQSIKAQVEAERRRRANGKAAFPR